MQDDTGPKAIEGNGQGFSRLIVTQALVDDERVAIRLAYQGFECDRFDYSGSQYSARLSKVHHAGQWDTAVQQGRSGEDRASVESVTGVADSPDIEVLQAMADGVLAIDWEVRTSKEHAFTHRRGGSTVAAALLRNHQDQRKIHTVNVGDSHVYLISKRRGEKQYTGKHLSHVHQPNGLDEHLRLEALESKTRPVQSSVMASYNQGLRVARGIGELDVMRQVGVIPLPGVFTYTCAPDEEGWLVTISDGGDRLSMDDIAELLNNAAEDDNVAEIILREARRGQTDDIGVTAVRIEQPLEPGQAIFAATADGHGDDGEVAHYACQQLPRRVETALQGDLKLPEGRYEIDGDALAAARQDRRTESGYYRLNRKVLRAMQQRFTEISEYFYDDDKCEKALQAAVRGKQPLSPSQFITLRRLFEEKQPDDHWLQKLLLKQPESSAFDGNLQKNADLNQPGKNRSLLEQWWAIHPAMMCLLAVAAGSALVALTLLILVVVPELALMGWPVALPFIIGALVVSGVLLAVCVGRDKACRNLMLHAVKSVLFDNKARLFLGAGLGITLFILLTTVFGVFGAGFSVPLLVLIGIGFSVGFIAVSVVFETVLVDWLFVGFLKWTAADKFASPAVQSSNSFVRVCSELDRGTFGLQNIVTEVQNSQGGYHYGFALLRGVMLTLCDMAAGKPVGGMAAELDDAVEPVCGK